MLRRKKLRRFETAILGGIALLLFGAGVFGVIVAIQRGRWQLGLASAGIVVLAIVYGYAVRRGRSL